jgi:prepilin-type N-terminal cleavage/methylation domain-containing protein
MTGANYKNKKNKGFTLIELMVSVLIFSILSGAIIGIFISSINTQKKILNDQKIISELSYVMEYISRALRMARKDDTGTCLDANESYRLTESQGIYVIRFLNYDYKCQEFGLNGTTGRIYEKMSSDENSSNLPLNELYVTSLNMYVDRLYFNNIGSDWGASPTIHPKVMINLRFKKSQDSSEDSSFILQTVVSQRNY